MSTPLAPTVREERIGMLDSTRGIAVLGILIMNITGFGIPRAYDDPTNWGGAQASNLDAEQPEVEPAPGINDAPTSEGAEAEPAAPDPAE